MPRARGNTTTTIRKTGKTAFSRPTRFEATEEQRKNVKVLVGLGIPEDAICAIVPDRRDKPISKSTLRKRFAKELETGAAELNAMVGNLLVATILGVEPSAGVKQITDEKIRGSLLDLFARSRLGWSTTVRNEIVNAEGKPFVYVASKTDAKL